MTTDIPLDIEAEAEGVWQELRSIAKEYPNVGSEMLDKWIVAADKDPDLNPRFFVEVLEAVADGRPGDFSKIGPDLRELIPYQSPTNNRERNGLLVRLMMLNAMSLCQHCRGFNQAGHPPAALAALVTASRTVGFLRGIAFGHSLNTELADRDAEGVRRAAHGRRLIGASTRERVRAEAEKHRHLSKGTAAFEIAAKIQLSPDRVRKLLSEIFPGDSWARSSDMTRRNS